MPGATDQNDPTYRDAKYASGRPRYVWSGGRWQALNDTPPPDLTDPSLTTKVTATSEGTSPEFFNLLPGAFGDVLGSLGLTPTRVAPGAVGAQLDTTDADADRARLAPLLAQLRNQASTGDGAWQPALAQATQRSQAQASALGQSQAGVGGATAARNIGNAQAGAAQRGAGQEVMLRNEAKNDATAQLGSLLGSMGGQDAGQAATEAGVRQGVRETNLGLLDQARQNGMRVLSGAAQTAGAMTGMSDGGPVPGRPAVFGDSEVNDTVPAMLSPGEIVIPRSHADSPESAASFVRALQSQRASTRGGVQHFDSGGEVNSGLEHGSVSDLVHNPIEAATIDNGGLLNTRAYDATREATLRNAATYAMPEYARPGEERTSQYQQNAQAGINQQLTNQADSNVAGAMAAQNPRQQAPAGDVLSRTTAATQQAGGAAANDALGAQNTTAKAFADAVLAQRARDQSIALAKQQAAWRNTQMNAGVTLQNQQLLRGIIGGAGQGFASFAGIHDGGDGIDRSSLGVADNDKAAIDRAWDGSGGDDEFGGGIGRARGGVIGDGFAGAVARGRFTAPARMMADGGSVGEGGPVQALGRLWKWAQPAPGEHVDVMTGRTVVDPPQHSTLFPVAPPQAPLISDEQAAAMMGAAPVPPPPAKPAPVAPAPVVAPAAAAKPPTKPVTAPAARAPTRAPATAPPNYFAQEASAAKATGEAEAAEGQAVAGILAQQQRAMEAAALDAKARQDSARATADASFAEIQKARDEMKNVDVSVDSGRWWATRSTPQKISGIIGLVLGTFGAGNDGVNRAAGMIDAAINRDLEAQKTEHEFRMKKGQQAIDSATSLYGMHRQQSQDDATADAAAQGTALALVQNQLAQAKARSSSPLAKANADLLMAKIGERGQAVDAEAKQRLFENHIKQQHADTERMRAEAEANKTHPGAAKAQEAMTEIESRAANMRTSLAKAKALIQKHGTFELTGPAQAELKKALTDYAIDGAKLKDPGSVARESEVEAELKSLGVSAGSLLTTNKTALELIDAAGRDINSRVNTAHQVRGIAPQSGNGATSDTAKKASLADWAKANPNDPRAAKVLERLGALP